MKLGVTAVMLPELDFDEQLRLCSTLGVTVYQFRPRLIPGAARGGPYGPWGTLPSASADDPDDALELHVRGAAAARAGRMRLAPASYPDGAFDYAAWLDATVARFRHVVEKISRPRRVKLVMETHAGTGAASPGLAWNIVRTFDPSEVGVIFDLNNFAREGEVTPNLAVSVLRDWIDCVHVGASRRRDAGRDPAGWRRIAHEACALADSDLPIPAWLDALRDAGVDVPVIVEDFSSVAPGPDRLRADAAFLKSLGVG